MNDKNEFLRGKPVDTQGEQLLSFAFKLVAVAIIAAGLQASALKFAWLMGYQAGWLGKPAFVLTLFGKSFPFYPFWMLFVWTLENLKRTQAHNALYSAWKVSIYASACSIIFYFFLEFVLIRNRKQNIFGSARWAKKKDLKKAGLLQSDGGMIIGQLGSAKVSAAYDLEKKSVILHLKKPAQKIIQSGIYNTNVAAPTRSGKGVSIVIPTCVSYPGSLIVLDFKGENFKYTSGFRKKLGKVYRWEPTGTGGHHFNFMEEIRAGEEAFGDANLIADILTTPPSGGGDATSDHFRSGAKDFLTSLILHCLTSPDWENKSLPGCREFLAQSDPEDPGNAEYIYDLMINGEHGDPLIHQAVVEGATAQRNRPSDERGSMLSTVNNALNVFANPKIKRNNQNSEFYIDEFAETGKPITLYLTIDYGMVATIAPLIRLFVTLFSRRFTSGETDANARKFKVPLLFILDEFDKLGRMDELEMNMGIHNGFGIHYMLIYQSLNQLDKLYTKDHAFLAHCRNSVFFTPGTGEYASAELISKICGRESFSKANISYSGNRGAMGFNSASLSSQDQERNLINADEIMKFPLDSFILLCQGLPPCIGKKNVYYEDPVFKARCYDPKTGANPPAFASREEAVRHAAATIKKIQRRRWYAYKAAPETKDIEMGEDEILRMYGKLGHLLEEENEEEVKDQKVPAMAEDKENFL